MPLWKHLGGVQTEIPCGVSIGIQDLTLPGDVSASSRYWAEDIIEPPVIVTTLGTIVAQKSPGWALT